MKKNFLNYIILAGVAGVLAGCEKKEFKEQPLSESNLEAGFTINKVNENNYIVQVKDSSYIMSKWDFGAGSGAAVGKATEKVFFPDAGSYTITHYAIGKGGTSFSSNTVVNVATSDAARGNLVQGGKFETADDESKWTKMTITPGVTWARNSGKMTATGGSGGHAAVYQTVTVQANKDYKFGMTVSGSGATDTWFEVYFGSTAPVAGSDYSNGGIKIALNTWAGCGNTTFNGNIASIGCSGDLVGKNGVIRFATAGTYYLFIKTGGSNLGTTGISIDNVELRGL